MAKAGRASVRLLKGNLAGASTDAGAIPSNTFVYRMPYYVNTVDQYNRIYWASANQPYRAHTVWGTFYDNYRRTTRDPRVPFDSSLTVRFGDAAVTSLGGQVRWFFQTKYPVRAVSYHPLTLPDNTKVVDVGAAVARTNKNNKYQHRLDR